MVSPERALDKIQRLAHGSQDVRSLWDEASEVIASVVDYDWHPCWFTLDPASLLITSHYNRDVEALDPAVFKNEYVDDDVNKLADLATSDSSVVTLHDATEGDPDRSYRHRELMAPYGLDQELILALSSEGLLWGAMTIYRAYDREPFSKDEITLLSQCGPFLATAARRGLLVAEATDPEGPDAPGLIVLDASGDVESTTPGVGRWLDELPDGDFARAGVLPSAVLAVAQRALRTARSDHPGEVAFARVLSRTGRWVVLHGAALVSHSSRTAVIIEPAHPGRIVPLLMRAYGLSEREQDVTQLVLEGASTSQIAQQLFLSAYTVQDHLKSVFEKTGVRTRRELMSRVFFDHYEPRVRDNESRVLSGQMIKGGPYDSSA